MKPLRACALALAALCLVGIAASRDLCVLSHVYTGIPADLRKATETLHWCDKARPAGNPFKEGPEYYFPDLKKTVSPEETVQSVLDQYKPRVDNWTSGFALRGKSLPKRAENNSLREYEFIKYIINCHMWVKNLTVHQFNPRNVSILLSVDLRPFTLHMAIYARVCISYPKLSYYNCAHVINVQDIKVKNATISLIATWKTPGSGEVLPLKPSDKIEMNYEGIELDRGHLFGHIPDERNTEFRDRIRGLIDPPAENSWHLFGNNITDWVKHGFKDQFDRSIRPEITKAFNFIIKNAIVEKRIRKDEFNMTYK